MAKKTNGKADPTTNGAEMTGAEMLRSELARRGWTQMRAAEAVSVSTTTVSRWLSGKRVPDREHMAAIRKTFGIGPEVWV